jgi:hypothetical protein
MAILNKRFHVVPTQLQGNGPCLVDAFGFSHLRPIFVVAPSRKSSFLAQVSAQLLSHCGLGSLDYSKTRVKHFGELKTAKIQEKRK